METADLNTLPKPLGEDKAQRLFDEKYISSAEVCTLLGVDRSTVANARLNGTLPDAICVLNRCYMWEREFIKPYLTAWKHSLDVRAGRKLP